MLTHDGLALTLCGKYDGRERHIPSTMRSHLQLRNPLQHSGSPASVPYYRNVKYMHTKVHCESPYGVHNTQHYVPPRIQHNIVDLRLATATKDSRPRGIRLIGQAIRRQRCPRQSLACWEKALPVGRRVGPVGGARCGCTSAGSVSAQAA